MDLMKFNCILILNFVDKNRSKYKSQNRRILMNIDLWQISDALVPIMNFYGKKFQRKSLMHKTLLTSNLLLCTSIFTAFSISSIWLYIRYFVFYFLSKNI